MAINGGVMLGRRFWRPLLMAALLVGGAGCVALDNRDGIFPPTALCAHLKGTIGCPRGSVPGRPEKAFDLDGSFELNDWVFTGINASTARLTLERAIRESQFKHIYYADWRLTSILGFVNCFGVTVYGR